jgi:sugar transferase (PEP-CTERM system associated)
MVLRIFRHFVPIPIILLAICEVSILIFVWNFLLADNFHHLFHGSPATTPSSIASLRWPSASLALSVGAVMMLIGFYHHEVFLNSRALVSRVLTSFGFFFSIVYLVNHYWIAPLGLTKPLWDIQAKALASWLLCICCTRVFFYCITNLDLFKLHVIVLGTANKAARIAALAAKARNRRFVPVAYLCCADEPQLVNTPPLNVRNGLLEVVREYRAVEIVVATEDRRGLPVHELLRCRAAGVHVIDYLDFIERETKTVDLATLQPSWLIFSDGFRGSVVAKLCKRVFDVALSLALLLVTLPLMLLASVAIMLEGPGPVLYRQERVGFGGQPFILLKFRSMRVDAEKDGGARWASNRDPRITRVGVIIRKLRIDELPQLLNVLQGAMSFVGPRPERPAFVADFIEKIPFYAERHCVKPGITGWAQINFPYGASFEDACEKLSYDLYYVKNHGLFLDLVIVLQTVRVILWADGAR